MRLLHLAAFLCLVVGIYSRATRTHRSSGAFQNNQNPYEVTLLDGRSPVKYHQECGKVLKEIAVLHPINAAKSEFVMKRILIEDETGKPASGECAEAILEQYEKEDSLRAPIVLRKRTGAVSAPQDYSSGSFPQDFSSGSDAYPPLPPLPPMPSTGSNRKKCAWIRRPIEQPTDQNPFAYRRDCRRKREPRPCTTSPWKSSLPCRSNQQPNYYEHRRVPEAFIPMPEYPVPEPLPQSRPPRKCANRRNPVAPPPSPVRRNQCRRDRTSSSSPYPCNHPYSTQPCQPAAILTPHSDYMEMRAARELTRQRIFKKETVKDEEPRYINLNDYEDRADRAAKETNKVALPVSAIEDKIETEMELKQVQNKIRADENILRNNAIVFPADVADEVKQDVKDEIQKEVEELKQVEDDLKGEVEEKTEEVEREVQKAVQLVIQREMAKEMQNELEESPLTEDGERVAPVYKRLSVLPPDEQ